MMNKIINEQARLVMSQRLARGQACFIVFLSKIVSFKGSKTKKRNNASLTPFSSTPFTLTSFMLPPLTPTPIISRNHRGFTIMEALIVISLLSIALMAFAKGSWSSATHVRNTHFADKAVLAGQDMVEMLSIIDIQELESTEPSEPVAFGSQKIIYDIVDSMDENNDGDVNNDGIPDFTTIAIKVYHSDDNVLSEDKLRVKNYYRRQTY